MTDALDSPAPAIMLGRAGWSLKVEEQPHFPAGGTHLERYASVLPAVEINSSFHRPHRPATYARWAASVPAHFRFSVKMPKRITHERRLADSEAQLDAFLAECGALGEKLGCLLVQLPPKLALDAAVAERFFGALRARTATEAVCEPRHPSWFGTEGEKLLQRFRIARVAADPACVPEAANPGGWNGIVYYRLHGSPRVYYSAYDDDYLDALSDRLHADAREGRAVWCIFDNTARGEATRNMLDLRRRLERHPWTLVMG